MRVRVSGLKATVEVKGKGSPRIVTDSNATARVFDDWLMSVGALSGAANVCEYAPRLINEKSSNKHRRLKRWKLVII
jgi:hypothetical protein